MPLMGLLGGVGQGLADTGQMMQKDALETRREKRLEEARMRQEERANTEWRDRSKITAEQQYGSGALDDPRGLLALGREGEARAKYGETVNLGDGTFNIERDRQMDDWHAQQDAGVGYHQRQAANTVAAQGTWERGSDDVLGEHEVNTATGQTRPLRPGAGSRHDAEGATGGLKDSDMRAIHTKEIAKLKSGVVPDGGEIVQGAMLDAFGGYEGWTKAYQEMMQTIPDYLEWREMVFGIPNPDRRQQEPEPGLVGAPPGGQPASGEQGYPEGTRLRGSDGKAYVVRGGVPVLAE